MAPSQILTALDLATTVGIDWTIFYTRLTESIWNSKTITEIKKQRKVYVYPSINQLDGNGKKEVAGI